jgi:hypothetical protein
MKEYAKIRFMKRTTYVEAFICYSRKEDRFRESTGVKISLEHVTDNGDVSDKHPNYYRDMWIVRQFHEWVENAIVGYVDKYRGKPSVEWLEAEYSKSNIERIVSQNAETFDQSEEPSHLVTTGSSTLTVTRSQITDSLNAGIFCHWMDFIDYKKLVLRTSGSVSRYNYTAAALYKFMETHRGRILTFQDLDLAFFIDVLYYLISEHKHVRVNNRRKDSTVVDMPEIGLSNDVVIKQMDIFIEYLRFCKKKRDVHIDIDDTKDYIRIARNKLEVQRQNLSKKWELTLTPEELQFVINLDHFEPIFYKSLSMNWRRFLDIFIFMCLQGTSPIDTKEVKKTDIFRGKIIGDRSKNGNEFRVELDPVAEKILIRNGYNLCFTDQVLNESIKKMFTTIFELYRPYFEEEFGESYQMIYEQRRFKGSEEVLNQMHKALFVEGMTGRRTFITNINVNVDELGMRENMRRAGHNRIDTHIGYQHDRQTGKTDRRSLFGVSTIIKPGKE